MVNDQNGQLTHFRRVDLPPLLGEYVDLDIVLVSEDQLVGLGVGVRDHLQAVGGRDPDGGKLHNLTLAVLNEELEKKWEKNEIRKKHVKRLLPDRTFHKFRASEFVNLRF